MLLATATRTRVARLLAVFTVAFGTAFYVVGDIVKPGYSSVSNFISELNATGTPWAVELGYFGFVPLGVLFAAFLITARPLACLGGASLLGWWLLWSQPIAFIGVALAPCDAGCPIGGSATQTVHDLLGVATYFAGAFALLLLSFAPVKPNASRFIPSYLRFAGVAFIVIFLAMLVPETSSVRGLLQRVADGLLAAALIFVAWWVVGPDDSIGNRGQKSE